jgi:hypothetical protein
MESLHNDRDGFVDDWDLSDSEIRMDMETLVRENEAKTAKTASNAGKINDRDELAVAVAVDDWDWDLSDSEIRMDMV